MSKKSALTLSPETLTLCKRLGAALRVARIRRRLTQAQLASRIGTSIATLQRMERGDPGLAVGSVMEALAVLERDWPQALLQQVHNDETGHALELRRLPKRVRETADDF